MRVIPSSHGQIILCFLNTFIENVRKAPNKVALEFFDPPLQRLRQMELDELAGRTVGYLQSVGFYPGI